MRYFVTGATGFIGQNLLKRLNGTVYCFKKGENVKQAIHDFRPDIIYHLAAEIYDEKEMFRSNVVLTWQLLTAITSYPIQSFIYIGSSSEYGEKKLPMTESDYLDPRTIYEATKGAGSLFCQAFARRHQKPIIIARPFSVYGPGEPDHRLIPTAIRCLKKNETITIAPGVHDFIYIDDFLDGLKLLESGEYAGEIFNFGTGIQYTNIELVDKLEKITSQTIKKQYTESLMRPYDSQNWVCDNTKARSIGWKVNHSLTEGLTKLL